MDAVTQKILSLSGLCRRAGGVVPGADAVITAVQKRSHMPVAVVMSSFASDRTKKQITDKTANAGIPLIIIEADAYDIGEKLGIISSCAVYALTGKGPAANILQIAREANIVRKADR
ncbi:MAG: hypothetical protein IJO81_04290 [Clostridia bacterium]|nr:hypothetical protein [Clostridia bacterium]